MATKTIICIPGLGASKHSFLPLGQTALASSHKMLAIDLAGFGARCTEVVANRPLTHAAQEVAERIDDIGGQNVVLVGHSLGGAVALLAAKMAKTRVFGMASVEGNLIAEDCGMSRTLAEASSLAECESIRRATVDEAARSDNPGVQDWARDLSSVSASALFEYSRQLVALSDSGELLNEFRAGEFRAAYIYGEDYRGHPVLERLGRIPSYFIPSAEHISFMRDAPEAMAAALMEWCDTVAGRSTRSSS